MDDNKDLNCIPLSKNCLKIIRNSREVVVALPVGSFDTRFLPTISS